MSRCTRSVHELSKTLKVDIDNAEYSYSLLTLVVCQLRAQGGLTHRGMLKKKTKDMWLEVRCEPGVYVAYVIL